MDQPHGKTRRRVLTGAAATAAGAAVTSAGAALLQSPSANGAGAPGFYNAGQVFVSKHGSDRNDGASWRSSLATIARALELVGNGTVYVGEGTFRGGLTINRAAVRGAGRDCTFIQAANPGQTIVTMTDGAALSDLNVNGGTRFTGTGILITGTLVHVQDVDVKNDDSTRPKAGYGGYGIVLRDGEGCLLTRVATTRQRLGWKVGGANHVFVQMRGDSNYKDILFGGESPSDADTFLKSGAHLVLGSKFVAGGNNGVPGAAAVRCLEIAGNGEHTLIDCDWEEADGVEWLVSSDNNVLTRCAVAPHTRLNMSGNFNTVQSLKVLGEFVVSGSDNTIWNTYAPNTPFVVNGHRNLVYGENGGRATGSGVRRLVFR